MRAGGESVNTEWARESHISANRLKPRQTYNVTAIALGQVADGKPLTSVKGSAVMEG